MPSRFRWVLVSLLFAALIESVGSTVRADAVDDERGHRARAIAENVMSPFCPGMTLASCTSPAARQWRADIREWVNEGLPDEEIRGRLEQRAGRDLSGTPRSSFNWLLPVAVSVGTALILGLLLRKWLRREPEASGPSLEPNLDAELEAALDRELEREDS